MSNDLTKTTVYVGTADYRRLRTLAREQGRSAAELVREAVAQYVAGRASAPQATSIGKGRSGRGDVAERAEELLGGMGREG